MVQSKEVTILMVEDDVVDQQAMRRALHELKFLNPLVVAEDGVEALEVLRNVDASGVRTPYIVLLDLNMPRMGGLEFLEVLRADESLKNTVVFALSTSNDSSDIKKAYKHNVAGYIVKSNVKDCFVDALSMLEHYWRIVELPVR